MSDIEDEKPKAEFNLSRGQGFTLAAVMTLSLMAALDSSSVSVTLPHIAEELHATAIQTFWTGTSYLLCCAVFQPIFGSLSGLFGRKIFILIAILFFFIGALVAGTAHNVLQILLGRSLQGVGGGGIITLASVLIADYVPLDRRASYLGLLSAMWALGSIFGPLIGGCFTEKSTWRWIFYINFPFIGMGTSLILLFMPKSLMKDSFQVQFRSVDWIGMPLFIASASSFLIPLSWGGIMYPWHSWHTLVPLIIGIAGLFIFAGYEYRYASHPIIPPAIFRNRFAAICFCLFCVAGFLLFCGLYYLPLYYMAVKGYSPIITGVALLPGTLTVAPVAAITGVLITTTGRYRWAIWAGWTLSTLGFGLLCLLQVNTSIPGWIFLNLVSGLGVGMCILSVALAVQASFEPEHAPIAVTMLTFFRSFGQSLGVAVGGAIFENRARTSLLKDPRMLHIADRYSRDAFAVIELLEKADQGTKFEIRSSYVDALRTVWAVCCALSGVALVLSLFVKAYRVR